MTLFASFGHSLVFGAKKVGARSPSLPGEAPASQGESWPSVRKGGVGAGKEKGTEGGGQGGFCAEV